MKQIQITFFIGADIATEQKKKVERFQKKLRDSLVEGKPIFLKDLDNEGILDRCSIYLTELAFGEVSASATFKIEEVKGFRQMKGFD